MKGKKEAKIWYDCSIPARLFFEILESGKLSELVKEGQEGMKVPANRKLEKAWKSIYDEFFTIKDDPKLKLIFKIKKKALMLQQRIDLTNKSLYAMATVPFTEEQLKQIATDLKKFHIKIDLELNLKEEIIRALNEDLPAVKSALELEISNLENLVKGKKSKFEEDCVLFEGFGYQVSENVSLRKYLAYEKAIIIKSKKYQENARR